MIKLFNFGSRKQLFNTRNLNLSSLNSIYDENQLSLSLFWFIIFISFLSCQYMFTFPGLWGRSCIYTMNKSMSNRFFDCLIGPRWRDGSFRKGWLRCAQCTNQLRTARSCLQTKGFGTIGTALPGVRRCGGTSTFCRACHLP